MESHQKKRILTFAKGIAKINKKPSKDLKKCMYDSCENMPSDKSIKKIRNIYKNTLKKECKEQDKNFFKCAVNFYNKSELKKVEDGLKKCKEKYCSHHTKTIVLNISRVSLENNQEKLNRYKCVKEYLESNDTSSKNKSKFIKKGKFLGKKEFDYILERKENDLKKVNEHIKTLEKYMSKTIKSIVTLEKELSKKSNKKSSKKSTKKSSKKSTKKSSKKSIKK